METLFIFDAFTCTKKLMPLESGATGGEIYLFPLTSKTSITKKIEEHFKKQGFTVKTIPSAEVISYRDKAVRDRYIKFVSDLPRKVRVNGKDLKEIFRVEKDFSLWWLSLIAEKNVYKSDSFNRLVQMDSIVSEIFKRGIGRIIFSAGSLKLQKALSEMCAARGVSFETWDINHKDSPAKKFFSEKIPPQVKHSFLMFSKAVHFAVRVVRVKKNFIFLNKKRRETLTDRLIMAITPYPDFDKSSASAGEFKNRYYGSLQEALNSRGEKVLWISMYVRNIAIPFKKSLQYARDFVKNDSLFFMLEEFSSLRAMGKALQEMLVSTFKFKALKNKIREASNFGEFNIYAFFEDDWHSSFAGGAGFYGLVLYYTFKNLFRQIHPKKCLYPCEMRAWEKALIAAATGESEKISFFAGQFGTVPRMHLNFFNHSDEIKDDDKYSMPQPDKVLCNGSLPLKSIAQSGWKEGKIHLVEALRYTYLKECLKQDFSSRKKNVVILLLSISAEESSSILSVSYEAFKSMDDIEVWIKPHPFLNLDKVFKEAGVKKESVFFKVKRGLLKDFLPEAKIAVTGESSAAVEALAFGCRVLIVDVPEWINLSPLRFVDTELTKTINSSESLRREVADILRATPQEKRDEEEKRRVVNEIFCLNPKTDVPEKFLEVLKNKS